VKNVKRMKFKFIMIVATAVYLPCNAMGYLRLGSKVEVLYISQVGKIISVGF
jgi:hypothetical protein